MEKKDSKVPYIIGILILSVIVIFFGTLIYSENKRANIIKSTLENTYIRSLNQVSEYISNISETLEKVEYVGTAGQMQILAANLSRDTSAAKTALTSLPTGELDLAYLNKFLSQAGNYTGSLAKKLEYGEKLSESEYENILKLKNHAKELNERIYKLGQDILSGKFSSDELTFKNENTQPNETDEEGLSNQIRDMEKGFVNYPSLIYDGPFSDHILNRNPELTKNKPKISKEQAFYIASQALEIPIENIEFTQMENSHMPCYCFKSNNSSVAITENGGYIAYMLKYKKPLTTEISINKAIENAENYLKHIGITSMKHNYYENKNNICTINFAYNKNTILYYTDLIKVSVDMENGEICGFDARGYIMNHKERKINEPFISKEKAAESISPKLNIVSVQRAVIPTAGKNEIPVYEFKTKSQNNQIILVYVNEKNGAEEQILVLVNTNNGVLTI